MLPLPAPQKVKCFWVRFRFQLLSSKCFRFHIPGFTVMQNQSMWKNKHFKHSRAHTKYRLDIILINHTHFENKRLDIISLNQPLGMSAKMPAMGFEPMSRCLYQPETYSGMEVAAIFKHLLDCLDWVGYRTEMHALMLACLVMWHVAFGAGFTKLIHYLQIKFILCQKTKKHKNITYHFCCALFWFVSVDLHIKLKILSQMGCNKDILLWKFKLNHY